MEQAAAHGAQLAVLPEGFLSAYELDAKETMAVAFDGPELSSLREKAASLDLVLCVGYLERSALGFHVSQAYLGSAIRLNYRKAHLTPCAPSRIWAL
jgi:predicted amidohydrolase